MPLRNIRFSLVDVPDLQVLPTEQDGLGEIWMGSGPGHSRLHQIARLAGPGRVCRGKGLLARVLCGLIGFPSIASATPVRVEMRSDKDGERWTRDFGG